MIAETTARTVPNPQKAAVQCEQEYAALLAMLRPLPADDWTRPTECPGWSVRDMVAHVTGAAEEAVRPTVQARHMAVARTRDRRLPVVDSLSAQQIAARADHGPAELLAELGRLASRAPRKRAAVPKLIRRTKLPAGVGAPQPGDTMAYLLDVIFTRDVWMHRIDIARATGCTMPESEAEPAVVAQIMRDLSRVWEGTPFTLTLTGRVPGTWAVGGDDTGRGGTVSVDTVALCRLLSGRTDETQPAYEGPYGPGAGVPEQLRGVRVLF